MSYLKGNYELKNAPVPSATDGRAAEELLEQEYYKAALGKLGGSIAFIMKGKTFLWKGDDGGKPSAPEKLLPLDGSNG